MSYEQVTVADGKYTVQIGVGTHAGHLNALRHGEPWQDLTGNNLVYWLAVELRNARDELQQRAAEVEQLKNQNRHVARMIVDNDRDGAVQWAKGLTASLADEIEVRVQAPAEAHGAADTVQLVGVKDGVETVIGTATMPPKMKARELVREMFGAWEPEDGSDADMAYAVCEQLIEWMPKNPPTFNVESKAQPKGTEPHGWIVWWPAMGGGHKPIYTHGPTKPSYGPELGSKLRLYPVYDASHFSPAPEVGAGEKWEADVECITDESGTDYSVSIRGPGLRNPDYSDVWLKKRPAEQLAKWLNKSVLPRFSAPAVKADEPAWELPTPAVGDYVLATKWSDGDPGDNWALGFYTHSDTLHGNEQTRRYYVADSAGNNIRGNGFRKVHGPIRGDVGRWLLEVASKQLEASPPGAVNLWTMLTPIAFDLERDRERAAIASKPPVQGKEQP